MEQPPTREQVPMPGVIPFFNPHEREDILKRRPSGYPRLSSDEAGKINSMRQTRRIAKAGLKFFNRAEDVNYELVDNDSNFSNWFYYFWPAAENYMHASFRAKMADDGSGKSNPTKLFFVEATMKKDLLGVDVLKCCIIDENDATKFTRGCLYCSERIIHPPAGQYQYDNIIFVNGCRYTVDFGKISQRELLELERSDGGLSGWTGIDGITQCGGKQAPPPTPPSGI